MSIDIKRGKMSIKIIITSGFGVLYFNITRNTNQPVFPEACAIYLALNTPIPE